MNKKEFNKELLRELADLPQEERAKIIDYYDELYFEKLEAGEGEEEIINSFGIPRQIAKRVLAESDTPFKRTARGIKEKGVSIFTNKTFLTVYFSLFFITIPLTLAALATVFSLLVGAAAIFFSVYVIVFSVAFAGVVSIVYAVVLLFTSFASGIAALGIALAAISIALLFAQVLKLQNKLLIHVFGKKNREVKQTPKALRTMLSPILALVILLTGSVFFTTGLGSVNWNLSALDTTKYEAASFDFDETITSLKLDATSGDFIIRKATDDNFRVDYHTFKNRKIEISVVSDQLRITETRDFPFFSINMFGWTSYKKQAVYIYIPEVIVEDSLLKVTSGMIDVNGIEFQGKLTVSVTSGDAKLNNIKTPNLVATCTSGEISGKIIMADKIYAKVTSGDINLKKLTTDNAEFNASSGYIGVGFTSSKNDFTFVITKTSGESNISSGGSGSKIAKANVSSGDIRFTFGV